MLLLARTIETILAALLLGLGWATWRRRHRAWPAQAAPVGDGTALPRSLANPPGSGRRMEAEWEKAARGTDGRIFPWGNELPTGSQVNGADRRMRLSPPDKFIGGDGRIDDGYARTAPVGSYPDGASPYGALDMAGNVAEWVNDWWDITYYTHSPARNPTGPATGVIDPGGWVGPVRDSRGGNFLVWGYDLRTTFRWPADIEEGYALGFRCARSP